MEADLITVEEALSRIGQNVSLLAPKLMSIDDASGLVLAEDLRSKINMPPFRQSAMDGYAVRFEDKGVEYLELIGEVAAGVDASSTQLKQGQAVRIFTGAMVPDSADTVIRQEDVVQLNSRIKIDIWPKRGANIRPEAEQTSKGEIIAKSGDVLNPARLSYVAGMGVSKLWCYPKANIAVVITGSELQKNTEDLRPGCIYESNSYAIIGSVKNIDNQYLKVFYLNDELKYSIEVFKTQLDEYDCVIFSGGISVGDYDFVAQILDDKSVEKVFYKVKQKPGKPLFFGKRDQQYIFALPGNPAAALTCMYVYVNPAIRKMMGWSEFYTDTINLSLKETIELNGGRSQFLKAKQDGGSVDVLEYQSSAMLKSFAEADCLVYLNGEKACYQKGEIVKCYKL